MPTPSPRLRLTIPTLLTLGRIAAIPVFVGVFFLHSWWSNALAAAIFVLAGITDYLDGYLARRLSQTSRFGAFLDPVADKLMVAAALVLLVEQHANGWLAIPALVIISREITVSALREWMAEIGKRTTVAVSYVGKVKTVMQIVAITVLLAIEPSFDAEHRLLFTDFMLAAYALMYIAMGLTLWSMIVYLRAAWPHLRDEE